MKTKHNIWMLLVFYTIACANRTPISTPDSLRPGKIVDSVICKMDPAQSYALYIPAKGNKVPLPVMYFFDPHGDGALPLHKYQSLADEYGFILIGSNNSKNGNDGSTTENIWNHLFDDSQSRLKIDRNRIYTGGFSGGAKVAGYVALHHPGIKGVIANGAGLPDGTPAGNLIFSFTAMAGEGDMNLTDLVGISDDLDKTRTRHRIIVFDGKHEWAPENSMSKAFAGLQFDAMLAALIPKDSPFISHYIAESKKKVGVYYQIQHLIQAMRECKLSISFLDGLTDEAGWFKKKASSLVGNRLYQEQQQAQESLLVREQNTKAGYRQHFQQDDMPYWMKTITDLQMKSKAGTVGNGMYQRLLAYLSLAFYSFSSHLINGHQDKEARHFVELYKMADPTNEEAWYFSAILNARDSQTQAAENDLLRAAEYGFKDRNRLLQQPEFQNGSPGINFSRIEREMHASRRH